MKSKRKNKGKASAARYKRDMYDEWLGSQEGGDDILGEILKERAGRFPPQMQKAAMFLDERRPAGGVGAGAAAAGVSLMQLLQAIGLHGKTNKFRRLQSQHSNYRAEQAHRNPGW